MSETTEIYSARGDENIRDGAMETSGSIDTREAAAADAQARCRRDPGISRIAYYRVGEDGGFRVLYSYRNPHAIAGRPDAPVSRPARRKAPSRPKPKRGLLDRVLDALRE